MSLVFKKLVISYDDGDFFRSIMQGYVYSLEHPTGSLEFSGNEGKADTGTTVALCCQSPSTEMRS